MIRVVHVTQHTNYNEKMLSLPLCMSVSEWLQPIVAKKGVVKLTSSDYGPSHLQTLNDESRQSYGFMPDPPNGFHQNVELRCAKGKERTGFSSTVGKEKEK